MSLNSLSESGLPSFILPCSPLHCLQNHHLYNTPAPPLQTLEAALQQYQPASRSYMNTACAYAHSSLPAHRNLDDSHYPSIQAFYLSNWCIQTGVLRAFHLDLNAKISCSICKKLSFLKSSILYRVHFCIFFQSSWNLCYSLNPHVLVQPHNHYSPRSIFHLQATLVRGVPRQQHLPIIPSLQFLQQLIVVKIHFLCLLSKTDTPARIFRLSIGPYFWISSHFSCNALCMLMVHSESDFFKHLGSTRRSHSISIVSALLFFDGTTVSYSSFPFSTFIMILSDEW